MVAERVVDLLEPIEIEHHHGPDAGVRCVGDVGDVPLEQRPRRQTGERVAGATNAVLATNMRAGEP